MPVWKSVGFRSQSDLVIRLTYFLLAIQLLVKQVHADNLACGAAQNDSINTQTTSNDGFSKDVKSDSISIIAKSVVLDEAAMTNFDPCKDLQINAVDVVLKGTLKWNGRSVKVNAVNLTVVGDSASLDASYQTVGLPDYHERAEAGEGYGDSGANGENGGNGGTGGNIDLTITNLHGGTLYILAKGGPGGMGEAGGDGHIGKPGNPNSDLSACCKKRSTTGLPGYKGGNAGSPGKSGDGGHGGNVNIRLSLSANKAEIMSRIKISVSGGMPGPSAEPGKVGPGGPGGAGSPTSSFNAGNWIDHKCGCQGDLGLDGPSGSLGWPALPVTPASVGVAGSTRIGVGSTVDVETPTALIHIVMKEANDKYKENEVRGTCMRGSSL
eukprot:m.115025 g.115025  ORF g.115025 m.115025 type:complete len:381 (+) comp37531_c0_seq2:94-1236(+)